jgi:hypothetical protein
MSDFDSVQARAELGMPYFAFSHFCEVSCILPKFRENLRDNHQLPSVFAKVA